MKTLFLIFHGFSEHNGISKKIRSQVEALRQNGIDTQLCYLRMNADGSHTRMLDDVELETYPNSIGGKIKKRICYRSVIDYVRESKTDLVYIRGANNINPFTISMVRGMRKAGAKVVWEIPTYPYDGEFKASSRKDKARLQVDKMCRGTQAKYLDYFVTYANVPQIFGAPTICISNGIDFDKIPVKTSQRSDKTELRMIAVAEIHFWHGFDRVVSGMAEYYAGKPSVKVVFDVVGYGGKALDQMKQMVADSGLEQYVTFHGPQYGEALDALFERADIGIASLGRHRSDITDIKTLKNREYAARGIPFVYSERDSDFDDRPYIMKAPADETPLDIAALVEFYDKFDMTPQEIRSTVAGLSWKNQMKKVTDTIFNTTR